MWLLEILIDGCNKLVNDLYTEFVAAINVCFSSQIVDSVLNMPIVKTSCAATSYISTLFCGVLGAKHIVTTYMLETDGDKDMNPLQFLVKSSISTAVIQSSNFIFTYANKLSVLACKYIVGDTSFTVADLNNNDNVTLLIGTKLVGGIYNCIFFVSTMIIIIKSVLRVAELVAMKVLLPLFSCDIMTASRKRWNTFIFSMFVTVFGYIIQVLMMNLGFRLYMYTENKYSLILALGILIFAIKAPKFLERYIYATGIGQSAGRFGQTAMYLMPQILRLSRR